MLKIIYLAHLFLFLLTCNTPVNGQSTSLTVDGFKEAFINKVTNQYQEKVFVDTDKTLYITGETIWLKAYCLDATFHVPSEISKVLNIELLVANGNAVKQERIELEQGFGAGQLFISPELASGKYVLRAYTNWMRNFDAEFVFSTEITIINPKVIPEPEIKLSSSRKLFVDFFPEGGHLVYGLESKIAIKVTDSDGVGSALNGVILDSNGSMVAEFTTSTNGYSSFYLKPDSNKTYFAQINFDDQKQSYQLPDIKSSGMVLTVITTDQRNFNITIQATGDFKQTAYLVVHSRGKIIKLEEVEIAAETNISLPRSILNDGITHITILNADFIPSVERLVFKFPGAEQLVDISLNKENFTRRDLASMTINYADQAKKEGIAELSISVFKSPEEFVTCENIITQLLLTSDLKGTIPDAWSYMNPDNSRREEQVDLLMLTNGWRRFAWEDIRENASFNPAYLAEINAPILSGHLIVDEFDTLPPTLQMGFIGRAAILNSTGLETSNSFNFEIPFRVKSDKVFFFINGDTLRNYQIQVESPFDLPRYPSNQHFRVFESELKPFLDELYTNIQLAQVYRNSSNINGLEKNKPEVITPFYGIPDKVYRLDDFTRFETMADLFLEYISVIYIRNRGESKWVNVDSKYRLSGEAMVMLDGLTVRDFDFVMDLDPLLIESIDIVDNYYFIGSLKYAGLVNFVTYKGEFAQQEVPDYLLELAYNALQTEREFYHPDYQVNSSKLERIPDYRTTLYWNPEVAISGDEKINLSFFTADDAGQYQIEINGISSSGQPIYSSGSFKVVIENLD